MKERCLGRKTHSVTTAKTSHLLTVVSVPTQGSKLRVGPDNMEKQSPLLCPHNSIVC